MSYEIFFFFAVQNHFKEMKSIFENFATFQFYN